MIKHWKAFFKTFKPSYNVDVTMYHFIPGMPVKAQKTRHPFRKGELLEASAFFDQASEKTLQHQVAPVEIALVCGRKRVIKTRHFGPVKALKMMRMSA